MANIIEMPKLSDTMVSGTLVRWLKKVGDPVKTGDILAEVETDKATMDLESFFDGVLVAVFIPAGSAVPIGAALCAVGKAGEKVAAPAPAAPQAAAAQAQAPAARPAPAPSPVAAPSPAPRAAAPLVSDPAARVKISPLARRLAAERGVDPSGIAGSGPGGRIVRADILSAPAPGAAGAAVAPRR